MGEISIEKKSTVDEIFSPLKRRFLRRRVIQRKLNDIWQADLCVLLSIAKENDGYSYLLTVIDNFSRYVFVRPLKTKTGVEVAKAFESIIVESKTPPKKLQVIEHLVHKTRK